MEELKNKVQYLKDVQGLSFRQIATHLGISRHKVSKLYSGNCQPPRPKEPLLNPYADLIVRWFKECPSLKAKQVYERLKQRGVPIGARTVDRYTQRFRKKKDKVYWPLTFLPGEEGQVDWFFVTHPHLGKLCGFALILSYSRYLFVHLFERASFEFFIQGHLMAFSAFGGYPHALRYDNLKSVVLKKEPLQYNPSFLEFARHYGFEIRLCNLAAGNEKGRVERVIRSMREAFLNTAEHHQSLKAMNHALHQWVAHKNDTIHRATQKKPIEAKKEEALKAIPDRPWNNVVIHPPKKTSKTGLLTFDTNSYSVPDYLTGKPISVHTTIDRIELYDMDGKRVASHARCFKRYQSIINPIHRSVVKLSTKAKRQRILALMKGLSPDMLLQGVSAYFTSIFDLTAKIKKAVNPHAKVEYYGKSVKVLCLDEVGYSFHDKEDMDLIFQIISKRSELLPTIVTTNLVPKQWGSIFSGTAASAILDRLSFNGKFLILEGKSYRARSKKK